jgi:hypothetical protein
MSQSRRALPPLRSSHLRRSTLLLYLLSLAGSSVFARSQSGARTVVPFNGSGEPKLVRARLLWGTLTVSAWDGQEVEVVVANPKRSEEKGDARGLSRIAFEPRPRVQREGNTVDVSVDPGAPAELWSVDLEIKVPAHTALDLTLERGGEIAVAGVDAKVHIVSRNGSVRLDRLGGGAAVETANGEIVASFTRVIAGDAISLASRNGKVDLTLPAAAGFDLRVKAPRGGLFTNFDIRQSGGDLTAERSLPESLTDESYKPRPGDGQLEGEVNGGGARLILATANGPIYIRHAQ